jgi:hypothetical protein
MAAVTPLARDVLRLNEAKEITITSKSAAFGADAVGGDYKVLMLFANAGDASANVTVEVGDGPLGAGQDLTFAVGAGKTKGIVLDSAYFKKFYGDYKDCYKVTPSAALSVSIIELPQ